MFKLPIDDLSWREFGDRNNPPAEQRIASLLAFDDWGGLPVNLHGSKRRTDFKALRDTIGAA